MADPEMLKKVHDLNVPDWRTAGQVDESMSSVLDAIPAEARAVIVDELTRRNPALLAELQDTQEPTTEQSDAVSLVLASAIVESLGPDWTPNKHGLAVEHAVTTFFEVWPRKR